MVRRRERECSAPAPRQAFHVWHSRLQDKVSPAQAVLKRCGSLASARNCSRTADAAAAITGPSCSTASSSVSACWPLSGARR